MTYPEDAYGEEVFDRLAFILKLDQYFEVYSVIKFVVKACKWIGILLRVCEPHLVLFSASLQVLFSFLASEGAIACHYISICSVWMRLSVNLIEAFCYDLLDFVFICLIKIVTHCSFSFKFTCSDS